MELRGPRGQLDLAVPRVMGVLNVTPDSFSDGGRHNTLEQACRHARRLTDEGADILDVGGESTRPGAAPVSEQQEMDRVCPVIERIRSEFDVWISLDSSRPQVMRESVRLGVDLLNDVRAFADPQAERVAVASGLPLCIMHMQGTPQTMQSNPDYQHVVSEVSGFLCRRAEELVAQGVRRENILIDPGFGFGKRLDDNLALFNGLPELAELGYPLLVGVSRKSMIGAITGEAVDNRLTSSVVLAALAARSGARVLRVHDVAETVAALKIIKALGDFS